MIPAIFYGWASMLYKPKPVYQSKIAGEWHLRTATI